LSTSSVRGEYFMEEGRLDTSGCLDFVKHLFFST
jgi:hypothetical protein